MHLCAYKKYPELKSPCKLKSNSVSKTFKLNLFKKYLRDHA